MRLQVVRQLSESVLRWWFLRRGGARKWEEICPQRKSLASKWARANSHLTASRRAAGDVRPRFKPAGFACAV